VKNRKDRQEGDGLLLRLREYYEQAVLDLFDANQEAKEVRPALEVVGHTSDFLDNMRLPVHRWFRYSAGFSAEWVPGPGPAQALFWLFPTEQAPPLTPLQAGD
jgi:hypothetical protein